MLFLEPSKPSQGTNYVIYDAYLCYANEDMEFVEMLSKFLESPEVRIIHASFIFSINPYCYSLKQVGFRLFIRDRDSLLGALEYSEFAYTIGIKGVLIT